MPSDKKQEYLATLDAEPLLNDDELADAFLSSETDIDEELVREKRLKNDDAAQNILLKRVVLDRLFWFLGIETSLIFLFTLFQATGWPFGFELQEWSFNILITATIAQIAGMLFVAVRYLFPTKNDR